jgi:ribonuclease HI
MEKVVAKGGFCVFTDGSGFEGGVGAAAVAMRGGRQKHLGLDSEHTVFESEVCVLLARLLRARRTLKLRLHWVPAHVGIEGNEAVDVCAKAAAQAASSPLSSRIRLFE